MTQPLNTKTPAIEDALYELSLERRIPDAELIDDIVRRYPEYATELTNFVIELVLDRFHDIVMEPEKANSDTDDLGISLSVSRALSRFQNRLYSVKKTTEDGIMNEAHANETFKVFNPFERLNREEFRKFVAKLGVNTVFVAKLRDRQIDPEEMTEGFREEVAKQLNVPTHLVAAHLAAPGAGVFAGQQFFKAAEKPSAGKRQSFEEAVRNSGLSKLQQQRLMSL